MRNGKMELTILRERLESLKIFYFLILPIMDMQGDAIPREIIVEPAFPKPLGSAKLPEQTIRRVLDRIDYSESLITLDTLLADRLLDRDIVSVKIGGYKKLKGLPILDPNREQSVKDSMYSLGTLECLSLDCQLSHMSEPGFQALSNTFWDAVMARSRIIQEQSSPDKTVNIGELRGKIDEINHEITLIMATRMRLFQDQVTIPGYGREKIHTSKNGEFSRIFEALDQLCMAIRGVKIASDDQGLWSHD